VQSDLFLIFFLVAAALWTVMARSLLRSAIGLALTSVLLSIIIFRFHSPLAAVFELSVCAGLISVLFVSTISLTHSLTQEETLRLMRRKRGRFYSLPLLVIALVFVFILIRSRLAIRPLPAETITDARVVLWGLRQIDLLGQVIVLLSGVFGVVVLLKERAKK
jgi:NADH-quinone oxidoreductase subunit J